MGTLRWEKEDEERTKTIQRRSEFDRKRVSLELAEADTRARIKVLEHDLDRQRAELATYFSDDQARIVSSSDRESSLRRIRSADLTERAGKGTTAPRETRHASNGSAKKNKTETLDGP
jgi:hypothetical protein